MIAEPARRGDRPSAEVIFWALDLETGGLRPDQYDILEIGLVPFTWEGPGEGQGWLVRPTRPVDPQALATSGLSLAELSQAPPLEQVWPQLTARLAGQLVVAHNAPFDQAFLRAAARRLGLPPLHVRWLDTLALTRLLWPGLSGYSLGALCQRLGLPRPGHRALPDARATGQIFLALLEGIASWSEEKWEEMAPSLPPEVLALAQGYSLEQDFRKLARTPGWSHRPGQRAYARRVAEALAAGKLALLEAGPGTGKTFGYLIPLLRRLAREGGRAVVTTRTRALQAQLWEHDLPFLLTELELQLPVALLKGRENYLCQRKLAELQGKLVDERALATLVGWSRHTETGDLDEVAELWASQEGRELLAQVRDSPLTCPGAACPWLRACHSRRARERARQAKLVVVNHALLGADLAWEGRVLGPYEFLVVDEAHALPAALRDAFSLEFSPTGVPWLLRTLRQGEELQGAVPEELLRKVAAAQRELWEALEPLVPEEPAAYSREDLEQVLPLGNMLRGTLEELASSLGESAAKLSEAGAELARNVAGAARRTAGTLRTIFSPDGEEFVFWWGREGGWPALHATPVEIAPLLAEALWPRLAAGVLTSATLAVGGNPDHLVRELGLPQDRVEFESWPSPFDYRRVRAFVLKRFPLPDDAAYPQAVARLLEEALAAVSCRALVLFTSRRLLLATRECLAGVPVLAQGVDGEREQLLARFRQHPPPVVLLGLDTMWEGVDLPGEELELLVITRLPFPVPTDPLAQALARRLRAQGRDPFPSLFLPQAVLRLRQGAGRLVRTPSDRGAIVITDPRASSRPYGAHFLSELPVPAQMLSHEGELAAALRSLFREG